jgi:hypothetical protein
MPSLRPWTAVVCLLAAQAAAVAQTQPTPPAGNSAPPEAPPPGYAPGPGSAPPPGYAPPPPGYAPPPPGYAPPPPGYAPPPPGYAPPPPGYAPPGYAPPPGYPPPPGYTYQRPRDVGPNHSGFLALPYLGIETHRGSTGNNDGVGFVLGVLLGGRLNEHISLNGEFTIDVLNPKNVPSGEDVTAVEVDIAFSPLFHLPLGNGELVVGPKLGIMAGAETDTSGGAQASARIDGYTAGLNLGAFFPINPSVSLGGLLNLELRKPGEECSTFPGESEVCDSTSSFPSQKIIAFNLGFLF